jgi:hypothetical protein
MRTKFLLLLLLAATITGSVAFALWFSRRADPAYQASLVASGPRPESAEAKLVRFLDKHAPELSIADQIAERHSGAPWVRRISESWTLKVTEETPWNKANPKLEHEVQADGWVVSYGGKSPETVKFIRIYASRRAHKWEDWRSGARVMTPEEAKAFLAALDGVIRAQSQAALGGAEVVAFNQDLKFGLSLNGEIHKQREWEKKSPEFAITLTVDKATISLRSGDVMELKLKVEAAMKWLETQTGDLQMVTSPAAPAEAKK